MVHQGKALGEEVVSTFVIVGVASLGALVLKGYHGVVLFISEFGNRKRATERLEHDFTWQRSTVRVRRNYPHNGA